MSNELQDVKNLFFLSFSATIAFYCHFVPILASHYTKDLLYLVTLAKNFLHIVLFNGDEKKKTSGP